jgi:7-cyano-7-deazaguanine tRNA-ribosyltransferase
MGFQGIMVNAYLLKKRTNNDTANIHSRLGFEGIISTDSGAYQILEYGEIDVKPIEIIKFQELISTDIGVILDIPTGYNLDRQKVKWTVDETLRRADISLKSLTRKDILWMGPIQGGVHLDLLAYSAKEISRRDFNILALGSPTQIMERYLFKQLVDMLLTVKMNTPINKPAHLFGAGHPMMLSLAAACGYDMFDSASYALYAKNDRYLTVEGTLRLEDIHFFPCICDECNRHSPEEVKKFLRHKRVEFLAKHNLWICMQEIMRIRQAISEGRLWELIRQRSRAHPALFEAFKQLAKYKKFLMLHSPQIKRRGIFYLSAEDLSRPEFMGYKERIDLEYSKPKKSIELILVPIPENKPYHIYLQRNNIPYKDIQEKHICFYGVPFGIVPVELDEVYPVSQTEVANHEEKESIREAASILIDYIKKKNYKTIHYIVRGKSHWAEFANLLKDAQEKKGRLFHEVKFERDLLKHLKEVMEDC